MRDTSTDRNRSTSSPSSGDRRKKRAVGPLLATEYLLDAHRERAGAEAVVLFECGELLASAGPLGADPSELFERDGDLYTHRLSLEGRPLVLASFGARVKSVRGVEEALARILA
jgi:hypothetical protein